jgi:hypothetical protein
MRGEWPQETGHCHRSDRVCLKKGRNAGPEGGFNTIKRQPELTPDKRERKEEGTTVAVFRRNSLVLE